MFKVNQKVWCLIYGQGVVTDVDSKRTEETYPVFVKFQNYDELHISYTMEGKFHNQGNITLFPYPVEVVKAVTKPSIDWNHVSKDFRYLVMDADGRCWLWVTKPAPFQEQWRGGGSAVKAENFSSFISGTCDWEDSLVKRPN